MRKEFTDKFGDDIYPIALNKIIVKFLGNILIRFDTTHAYFKHFIKNNGQTLKRVIQNDLKHKVDGYTIGCSCDISKGITEIQIKVIDPGSSDAIGITSDIDECKKSLWVNQQNGYHYSWYGSSLWALKRKKVIDCKHTDYNMDINDIVTIKIDCDKWRVSFYKNEIELGSLAIKENLEYYFFIGSQVYAEDSEYQILM